MCGIVGLYPKNPELEQSLGGLLAKMLVQMSDRGPDSAGFALYRNPVGEDLVKITLQVVGGHEFDWDELGDSLKTRFGNDLKLTPVENHAVIVTGSEPEAFIQWIQKNTPQYRITSWGKSIEIYKEKGSPSEVIERFHLEEIAATHALGHTRMATESAVTTEHSHPFSTGLDLCLVHNGSLSNHNRLREYLKSEGIIFQTDNDSEVAAGYLTYRLRLGDSLNEALEHAIEDLDGFYTFAIGTRHGFAVLRDPIACKPAVLAETDDWVAMASEFRAIAQLPGADQARVWEPEPARVYSWESNQ
jgi:glutamate synthase domain-containing protein 1